MTQRIALTPGEPAGIGPDLVVQIAQQPLPAEMIVLADPDLLAERAQQLQLPLKIIEYKPEIKPELHRAGELIVLPVPLKQRVQCGILERNNAVYVLATLTRAAQGCLNGEFSALVTGPVHKGIINQAGYPFSGHTEFLAAQAKVSDVVMMLMTKDLRVALMTTHLPLREVADAITPDKLKTTIKILQTELKNKFNISEPKILVCGLNPHAGENGEIGREEIEIIIPVLDELRSLGINLTGPVAADTAFLPKNIDEFDVILAMYHDQGLPVLKHLGFEDAINITLGLPFIRTSVDHGTALELAGTGKASMKSLLNAIDVAAIGQGK